MLGAESMNRALGGSSGFFGKSGISPLKKTGVAKLRQAAGCPLPCESRKLAPSPFHISRAQALIDHLPRNDRFRIDHGAGILS